MFKLTLQEIAKKKNVAEPITLWFVRHGESTANLQGEKCLVEHDTELTESGQKWQSKVDQIEIERQSIHNATI